MFSFAWFLYFIPNILQGCRERGTGGASPPPSISISREQKIFFHVKLGNIKFLHMNNMWDHSLFIEQDVSDKK